MASSSLLTKNPTILNHVTLGIYTYFSKIDEYERCFLLIFLIFRLLLRTDIPKSNIKKLLDFTGCLL
jgi:hypothetical protein